MTRKCPNDDLGLYIIASGNALKSYALKNQTPTEGITSFAGDLCRFTDIYNETCPGSQKLSPNKIIPPTYLFSATP